MSSFNLLSNLSIPQNFDWGTGLLAVGGGVLCGAQARLMFLERRKSASLLKENLELRSCLSEIETKLNTEQRETQNVIENNMIINEDYEQCKNNIMKQIYLLKEYISDNETLKYELTCKKNEIMENKHSLDNLQAKIEMLSKNAQDLEKEVEFLKKQNNDLILTQKTTNELLKTYEDDMQKKDVALQEYSSQIVQLQKELTSTESELIYAKISSEAQGVAISIKDGQRDDLKNTIKNQDTDMKKMSNYITELEQKIETLKTQSEDMIKNQKTLKEQVAAHIEDIKLKNDSIHKSDLTIKNLKSVLTFKTNQLHESQLTVEAKNICISLLEEENSTMMDKITNHVLRQLYLQPMTPDVSER